MEGEPRDCWCPWGDDFTVTLALNTDGKSWLYLFFSVKKNTACLYCSDEAEALCQDVGVTQLTTNLASANIPGAALGLVLVKHSGEWGTVCDNEFDNDDAKVP